MKVMVIELKKLIGCKPEIFLSTEGGLCFVNFFGKLMKTKK